MENMEADLPACPKAEANEAERLRLTEAVQKNSEDAQSIFALAHLHACAGRSENSEEARRHMQEAKLLFERMITLDPKDPEPYILMAELCCGTDAGRDPERGKTLFLQVLAMGKALARADTGLGACYYNQALYADAETYLKAALASARPRDRVQVRRAKEFLGRIYTAQGKFALAEQVLHEILAGQDEHGQAYAEYLGCPNQALGVLYSRLGHSRKMVEHFIKAAEIETGLPNTQYEAALRCYLIGDNEGAMKYVDRALALARDRNYQELKERILWASGKTAAIPKYEASGDNPLANFFFALDSYEYGNYAGAERHIDLMLRRTPQDARFNTVKGFLALLQQKYDDAHRLFSKAARSDPQDRGAQAGLGHVAVIRKDYAAAQKSLTPIITSFAPYFAAESKEISTAPKYDWFTYEMACLGMAWTNANQARHEEAIGYYDRILLRKPYDAYALLGKGNSLAGLRRFDEAEGLFRTVLEMDPENPYAHAELGIIQYNRGDDAGAEGSFRQALAREGEKYTCPYEGLGLVYLRQGKVEEARRNFERSIKINPDIEYKKFNGLAKIYLKEGRLKEAEKLLRKSVANYPYDGEAGELLSDLEKHRQSAKP
jgi:tetratricopeptide (TPR) repeat protein